MAGADIRYIPYRTTPQATADLIGGRISMIWLSSLGNLAGSDAVRSFATTLAGGRWKQHPELPTFDELGLKDYEITTWVGMFAPKNAPAEVTEKLAAAVSAALADPEVQKRFEKLGVVNPRSTGPAYLKKYLHEEIEKWGDILRTTKDSD
jgi:tripartite-type tricarboxylate transporter receptor subunit TctC